MSGTITRIAATGAGALLAIGFFATPPAGAKSSERSGRGERPQTAACFDETGRTQGRSHSDPDAMENKGFDKPGCTGGFDADRDGNNGCGNDADREDDNNGHCGRGRAGQGERTSPTSSTTTTSTTEPVIVERDISASSAGTGSVAGSSTDVAGDTARTAGVASSQRPLREAPQLQARPGRRVSRPNAARAPSPRDATARARARSVSHHRAGPEHAHARR